jgi:hypothetical protein
MAHYLHDERVVTDVLSIIQWTNLKAKNIPFPLPKGKGFRTQDNSFWYYLLESS